ncbi:MAG: outer membrane beta-barrel protein [Vicinamibacteria bacterium]
MSRVLFALALLTIPAAALAQEEPERLELTGFVGGMSLTQGLGTASNLYMTVRGAAENVDFGKLFGFRASWAFTRNIAAEFHLSRSTNPYTFQVDDHEVGNVSLAVPFEAEQLFYTGGIVAQFPTPVGLVPYGTVGVGQLRTKPRNTIEGLEEVTGTDVSFGGGVKYWVPSLPWLGLGFDLRYHTASDGLTFPDGDDSPRGTEFTGGGMVRLF